MRVIHLLNWNIRDIEQYLDEIKECGFDAIQITPMQPKKKTEDFNWWASYQPLDFKIGNEFGNKYDLKHLCYEAKKRNIQIIADVVCNHMANDGENYDQLIKPNKDVAENLKNNKDFWKKHNKICNFNNWNEIITDSIGLPGLNLKNSELQNIIFKYLEELKECGVKGFRIDAAKHIGLPSDGNDFFEKLSKYAKDYNITIYGEFLGDYKDKKNELAKYINVLTEPYAHINDTNKMFTFVESHDSFLNADEYTKSKTFNEIIDEFDNLCEIYCNTIFYVRDNFKPYNPYGRTINDKTVIRKDYSLIDIILKDEKLKKANYKTANNRIKMDYDEKIFNQTCMNIHRLILNNVLNYSSLDINNIIKIVLCDYDILTHLNKCLNIRSSDEIDIFLLDCIMYELYNTNKETMNNINYEKLYIQILNELKSKLLNSENINDRIINEKIKKLKNI